MAGHNGQALSIRVTQIILKAAQDLGKDSFTTGDLAIKVHESLPSLPITNIRAYILEMSSNHGHPQYFDPLGDGTYRIAHAKNQTSPQPPPPPQPPKPQTKAATTNEVISQILSTEITRQPSQAEPTPPQNENTNRPARINPEQAAAIDEPFVWTEKYDFVQKYGSLVVSWSRENRNALLLGRRNYRWQHESLAESIDRRNGLSKMLVLSRIRNNGGVDRQTLDAIMAWGFPNPLFPERDELRCIEVTREAFALLDEGKPSQAVLKLMSISAVGISRASKIIGLFDQNYLAVFDSRIGHALKNLKLGNERIVKCPPGVNRPGDINCSARDWAENYQRLLWVLEIIRNELNDEGYPFSVADVEMALFMMGK